VKKFDATKFIYDAISAGAIAVVTDIYDPFLKNITQIISDDINVIESDIAASFYKNPSKELKTIGITGTNGKTTTSYLIKHILDNSEKKCGLIGSVEYILGDNKISSSLTTPDCVSLQKYLREMKNFEQKCVCMETSSHALEQNRLNNIDFDIAIFTNLSLDHLDYHKTFDNYKNAKKKLFDNLEKRAFAVINLDDENSLDIIKDTKAKIITYSCKKDATFVATDIIYSMRGTSFTLNYKNQKIPIFTHLIGKYNVYNSLCAIAVAIMAGVDLEKLASIIKAFRKVPGRLEKVQNNKNLHIYVDHAHTPDAMQNVLKTLSEMKKGKVINVFGCGGDRDKSKRQPMAKTSEKFSDISIVTSDNPRTEDPKKIIDEIIPGFSKNAQYIVEIDRQKAIEKAIKLAKSEDIVIITGKGHETYQIFNNITIDFDDRKVSKQICSTL